MCTKSVNGDYIVFISRDNSGTIEITEAEYNEIMAVIQSAPHAEGKGYRLKTDLTWEEYDLPVPSEDDEIDADEALSIITGEST